MILPVPWTQAELDRRIDEVLVDAYGEGEELGAWAVALGDTNRPALSATVMGIPVELVGVEPPELGGGLRARCRRAPATDVGHHLCMGHHVSGFLGKVRSASHGNACICLRQRSRIVG